MYELEELTDDVADQVDAIPRAARTDYEAALDSILCKPFHNDLLGHGTPNRSSRFRSFALGHGLIFYYVNPVTNRVELDDVRYLQTVP